MREFFDDLLCRSYSRITGRTAESGTQATLFFIVLAVSCVVYAQALLFPVLGIDTYTYFLSDGAGDARFDVIRGTWGVSLLNSMLSGPLVFPLISMLFFLILNTWIATLIAQFWGEHRPDWKTYSTALLIVLFPYWASQAYFSYYHYGYALATFFGVLTVLLPWHQGGLWRITGSAACFVAGASMYQGSMTIATGFAGASLLVGTVRMLKDTTAQPFFTFSSLIRISTAMLTGGACYLVLHEIVLKVSRFSDDYTYYGVHFDLDLQRPLQFLRCIIPGSEFLLPHQTSTILYLFVLTLFGGIAVKLYHKESRLWALVPVILAVAVLSPLSLSVIQPIPLMPRSLASTAFVWSAVFLAAALLWEQKLRKPFITAVVILGLIFASRINYAWFVQRLTTDSDRINATLMYQRLASLPEFATAPKPVTVVLAGCRPESSSPWPQDMDSIFGVSQFACFGGKTLIQHAWAVFQFTGGHMILAHETPRDLNLVKDRQPWPASESVFADKNRFVIWLGSPQGWQSDHKRDLEYFANAFRIHDPSVTGNAHPPQDVWPFALSRLGKEVWTSAQKELRSLSGHVDAYRPLEGEPRFSRVSGWAFDQERKTLPQYVALLDCSDRIAGFAATGTPRQDLVENVATDAYYAGFEGYALNNVPICRIAYEFH